MDFTQQWSNITWEVQEFEGDKAKEFSGEDKGMCVCVGGWQSTSLVNLLNAISF